MMLDTLDRTQWSFDETLAHVERVVAARHEANATSRPSAHPGMPWDQSWKAEAAWTMDGYEQLIVALRDGDLHALGRYSMERANGWRGTLAETRFRFHSGYHTSIRPEQWREGEYHNGRLTTSSWEFIDIRMPRFMVKAIWPDFGQQTIVQSDITTYTTPYLELMQAAIIKFEITAQWQDKKDCLVGWFLEQEIDGEPVSKNLADAMATLIRLPAAQRGGAKRAFGPELRRTG